MSLIDLIAAKRHLQIPVTTTSDDDLVQAYIDRADQLILSFCERKFEEATYTEKHHGRRQNLLMPREYPITAVTDIRVSNDRDFSNADTIIDSSTYEIVDFDTTVIYDGIFPSGRGNIQITYTAGYPAGSIPADLQLAALLMVEFYFRHRERGDIGRTSASKGDESVGVLAEMPKMITEILMNYKRTEMAPANSPVRNY